ncbi:MAG: DUF1588 domain-containing protein [Vicinamibacterales bacterium]
MRTARGSWGRASVLTVTSYATRTSVVQRGKYIMTNILGTPPPPPPPNVPPLADKGQGGVPASLRARMEQHRANPVCAACHSRMDPLGFALENFNAIGQWREMDAGSRIETVRHVPRRHEVQRSVGVPPGAAVAPRSSSFARSPRSSPPTHSAAASSTYDQPSIRKVLRDAASSDYTWSSIILGIVKSTPFQMRMSRDADAPAASVARLQ